jgi:hypothetical protein
VASKPGVPQTVEERNIESFNGRVHDECLNINLFCSITQARVIISDWKDEYNNHQRHSSLGLPHPGQLRCSLHSPIADSHRGWIHTWGPGSRHPSTAYSIIGPRDHGVARAKSFTLRTTTNAESKIN